MNGKTELNEEIPKMQDYEKFNDEITFHQKTFTQSGGLQCRVTMRGLVKMTWPTK